MRGLAWMASIGVIACGGGEPAETTPILERPPRIAQTCAQVGATTVLSGESWSLALAAADGRYHTLTGRLDGTVAVAELAFDPIGLAPPAWSSSRTDWVYDPNIVEREGGGLALAWSERDVDARRAAILLVDAGGAPVGDVRYVPLELDASALRLVTRPGGYVLMWAMPDGLHLQRLDAAGAATGSPAVVGAPYATGQLVSHRGGFALVWNESEEDRTAIVLRFLDASLAPLGGPVRLSGERERYHHSEFAVSLGDELLVAWTAFDTPEEIDEQDPDESGTAIIRVARIAADGQLREPVLRLQAPEPGIVHVNPSVLPVAGGLAVAWSKGRYIPVCGGCITDNRMQLVMLDLFDLAPTSNLVEIAGPSGLRSVPIVSANDTDFAFLMMVDYHARHDVAAALTRCTPSM